MVLAGWWYRVGATVIDGLVLAIPSVIVALNSSRLGGLVASSLIHFVYIGGMLATKGQTVGNMAVHTRVADARTGGWITPGRGFGRAGAQLMFEILTSLLLFPVIAELLDVLWPLWDKDNQTLHDKMAGTVVLRVP